jgi:hypothetical protein
MAGTTSRQVRVELKHGKSHRRELCASIAKRDYCDGEYY